MDAGTLILVLVEVMPFLSVIPDADLLICIPGMKILNAPC